MKHILIGAALYVAFIFAGSVLIALMPVIPACSISQYFYVCKRGR